MIATATVQVRLGSLGVALIDAADSELVNQYSWFQSRDYKTGRTIYAVTQVQRNGQRRHIQMHRIITGAKPGEIVDHINGNGLDNRRCNLRICTHAENQRNQAKTRGSSRFKGVSWHKAAGKWSASIRCDGKSRHIGLFAIEEHAAAAYDRKAIELFGEFARLNYPQPATQSQASA